MKLPEPYRACSCRDAETGRLLGRACTELTRTRTHGGWYARYEAPRAADGRRRRPRIGPYPTRKACSEALVAALGRVGQGVHVDDRRTRFGDYLTRRLRWWESEAELKPSTLASYREAVNLYYRPALGHIRLVDLRDHHFRDMYAAMRLINRPGQDDDHSDLLRRLLKARSERDGRRISTRPLSEARIKRIHAVALSAMADAVPHTLPYNPAGLVKLGGKRGARKVKPLLWTAPRVERWQQTGQVPAPVMVWTAEQCGAFLDSLEAGEEPKREAERLYALFHLAAYFGLRRSELAGLSWADMLLAQGSAGRAHRMGAGLDRLRPRVHPRRRNAAARRMDQRAVRHARESGRASACPASRPQARRRDDAAHGSPAPEGHQRHARPRNRGLHDGHLHRGSRGAGRGRGAGDRRVHSPAGTA